MKILIVSNLYPPHHHGGYELRCAQVADYLTRQGHAVRVVTSDYQITGATHGAAVREESVNGIRVSRLLRQHRLAPWQPGGRLYNLDVVKRQIVDLSSFRDILDEWKPDLINWWNLEGVTKVMLGICRDRGLPSVHCVDDGWMIQEFGVAGDIDAPFWLEFWRVKWGPRLLRPVVRLCLAPLERRLQRQGLPTRTIAMPQGHVCFISEFWRFLHEQAGFDVRVVLSHLWRRLTREIFFPPRARGLRRRAAAPSVCRTSRPAKRSAYDRRGTGTHPRGRAQQDAPLDCAYRTGARRRLCERHHGADRPAWLVAAHYVSRPRPSRRDARRLCRASRPGVRQYKERRHADGHDGSDVRGVRGAQHRKRRRDRARRAGRNAALSQGSCLCPQPAAVPRSRKTGRVWPTSPSAASKPCSMSSRSIGCWKRPAPSSPEPPDSPTPPTCSPRRASARERAPAPA